MATGAVSQGKIQMPWRHPWTVKRATTTTVGRVMTDTPTKLAPPPRASLNQFPWQPEAYHHMVMGQVLELIPVLEMEVEVRSDTVVAATANSLDQMG